MPRTQRNDNFIDKTFTVIADILLKVLPTSQREKKAFSYYRNGMSAAKAFDWAYTDTERRKLEEQIGLARKNVCFC
jgi:hypothetical protein